MSSIIFGILAVFAALSIGGLWIIRIRRTRIELAERRREREERRERRERYCYEDEEPEVDDRRRYVSGEYAGLIQH